MTERVNSKHEYLSYWNLRALVDRTEVARSEYVSLAGDFSLASIVLLSQHQFGNDYYVQMNTLQSIYESGLLQKLKELKSTHGGAIKEIFIQPTLPYANDWAPMSAAVDSLYVNLIPKLGHVLYEPLTSNGLEIRVTEPELTLLLKPYQRSL